MAVHRIGTVIPSITPAGQRNTIPDPHVSEYLVKTRTFGSRVEAYTHAYWAARNWASANVGEEDTIELYHHGNLQEAYCSGPVDGFLDAGLLDGRRFDLDLKVPKTNFKDLAADPYWDTDDAVWMIGHPNGPHSEIGDRWGVAQRPK